MQVLSLDSWLLILISHSVYLWRTMKGLVLKSTGSWFEVADVNGDVVSCRMRGQLRLKVTDTTSPVSVGDHVEYEVEKDGTGVIMDVLPRTNYIVRKSVKLSKQSHIIAANIDRAWLVVTPVYPKTSTGFIDRFIAGAESFRIPVTLIFNKADLFKEEWTEIGKVKLRLRGLGDQVVFENVSENLESETPNENFNASSSVGKK